LNDHKKGGVDRTQSSSLLVDFMGTCLKGLDFTQRIKDNTEFNLSNIELGYHFEEEKK